MFIKYLDDDINCALRSAVEVLIVGQITPDDADTLSRTGHRVVPTTSGLSVAKKSLRLARLDSLRKKFPAKYSVAESTIKSGAHDQLPRGVEKKAIKSKCRIGVLASADDRVVSALRAWL